MARRKQPIIPDQVLDQLLAGADAKAAFEKDGLVAARIVEMKTKIKVHLPTSAPDQSILHLVLGRLLRLVT